MTRTSRAGIRTVSVLAALFSLSACDLAGSPPAEVFEQYLSRQLTMSNITTTVRNVKVESCEKSEGFTFCVITADQNSNYSGEFKNNPKRKIFRVKLFKDESGWKPREFTVQ